MPLDPRPSHQFAAPQPSAPSTAWPRSSSPSQGAPPIAGQPPVPAPSPDAGRSPLIDWLPGLEWSSNGARQFTIPAGTTARTRACWLPIHSLRCREDLGFEGLLTGITVEQLPTDPAAAGGADALAWGDTSGGSAAVVVGLDLPMGALGGTDLVDAPCPIVGVDAADAYGPFSASAARIFHCGFPSGTIADTSPRPFRRIYPHVFGFPGVRLTQGSRLDAALVVLGSQVVNAGGTDLFLYCDIKVTFHLASLSTRGRFTN